MDGDRWRRVLSRSYVVLERNIGARHRWQRIHRKPSGREARRRWRAGDVNRIDRGDTLAVPRRGGVETRVGDLRDPAAAARAAAGHEVVLHLAARVGGIAYNIGHPASLFRDNLAAYMKVLDAARTAGVARFLVASSACVYPRACSVPAPESEGFLDRPEPSNEGYGWSKRMEEFLGESYAREYGMDIRIARPYNAYGPRDDFHPETSHVIPGFIRTIIAGRGPLVVWGDGTATRSFLYVSDLVRGLMAVAERSPSAAPIDIGPSEEVTIRELARSSSKKPEAAPTSCSTRPSRAASRAGRATRRTPDSYSASRPRFRCAKASGGRSSGTARRASRQSGDRLGHRSVGRPSRREWRSD
jgi:nucleoside-diphosphate-sugar epimerase